MADKLNISLIKKALDSVGELESPLKVLQDSARFRSALEEAVGSECKEELEAVVKAAEAIRQPLSESVDSTVKEQEKYAAAALKALDGADVETEVKELVWDLFCREFKITAKNKYRSRRGGRYFKYALIAAALVIALGCMLWNFMGAKPQKSTDLTDNSFRAYEQQALSGDAEAQLKLGAFYELGIETDQDLSKAFFWYKKAADQNNKEAQKQLGQMYYKGGGTEKNYKKALEWFERSGIVDTTVLLDSGAIYYKGGYGVDKDYKKAVKYFEHALLYNNELAHRYLYEIYKNGGYGIERNEEKAKSYIDSEDLKDENISSRALISAYMSEGPLADPEYKKKLIELYHNFRKADAGTMESGTDELVEGSFYLESGFGVERDYKKAFELFSAALKNNGDPLAYIHLGICYENGWGIEKNKDEAQKLYKKAVEEYSKFPDFAVSKAVLGQCCQLGRGVEQSYAEAFKYYSQISDKDDGLIDGAGHFSLAYLYENGYGVEQDYKKAFDLYRSAWESANNIAPYRIGCLFAEGLGCAKDTARADRIFERAFPKLQIDMQAGDEYAKYYLAECYEYGRGCQKNRDEAVRLYKELAAYESNFEIKERAQKKLAGLQIK